MLKNLYFFKNYNDYFNREIKYQEKLSDYTDSLDYTVINSVNFDINDNVNAALVVPEGSAATDEQVTTGIWRHGTYMIAQDVGDTNDTIDITRWFVLEAEFIRQGRYKLTLRRDLVSDFLNPLLTSTVYVEKGYIRNNTTAIADYNPIAFNQESFTANQIKKSETPIKDKAGCKWVVGYLNKNAYQEAQTIKTYSNTALTPNFEYSSLANSPFANYVDTTTLEPIPLCYIQSLEAEFDVHYYASAQTGGSYYHYVVGKNNATRTESSASNYKGYIKCTADPVLPISLSSTAYGAPKGNYEDMIDTIEQQYDYIVDQPTWEAALNKGGKVVYFSDTDKYYRIVIEETRATTAAMRVDPNTDTASNYQRLKRFVTTGAQPCYISQDSANNFTIKVSLSKKISLRLIEEANDGYSFWYNPQALNRTINEAFDAFAIPVLDDYTFFVRDKTVGVTNFFSADYNSAFAVGQELTDITTTALDLQLLPYAPIPDDWFSTHTVIQADLDREGNKMPSSYLGKEILEIHPPRDSEGRDYAIVNSEDETKEMNFIFFLSSTQFSKVIPFEDTNDYSSIEKVKCINQLDTWRLESGDYSSAFEFNMARNGSVAYFEVDCAYKPYSPYIHISPNFGGLYGSDFNDTRGLICSNTNYSLPRITDAWESYERNNVNYLNAWNRQLENMDINREYQRRRETAQAWAGAVSAAGSGAIMGTAAGKLGVGTAIGAAAGGAASLGLGYYDRYLNDQLYKENKQYAQDQFDMNLQNIQALPNTMTAAGAMNPNNKVFPQLTFYSCSDLERETFLQKLKWDGMSIGVLTDNIADYVNPDKKSYFKGRLVYMPLEDADIESHEMSELANEVAKGILIDKGVIK